MIDIHCHILPGLDDGPSDIAMSVALARLAAADGTRTMVATPHVREDYPYELSAIDAGVATLNEQLEREGVELRVIAGAEVALSRVSTLDDATLAGLCLGAATALLVESPYQEATDMLEDSLFELQVRGFRPVLAHPERSPSFMSDPDRLARLVERGIYCSVTAASMAGRFGNTVQRFVALLLERGLVHDVASDAHDIRRRAPGLSGGFRVLERELPGLTTATGWFTEQAPATILDGGDVGPPPPLRPRRRLRGLRKG